MIREPNTEYILSLSYGKDSLACLEAIRQLGYPLDRIVHAEVWATDTIPADLPPMVEFKKKADQLILDRYGIAVEHICASGAVERERESLSEDDSIRDSRQAVRLTYESIFYRPTRKFDGGGEVLRVPDAQRELVYRPQITGFATKWSQYCTGYLKKRVFKQRPATRRSYKYCAVSRNSSRRARTHQATYEARNCSSAGRHWME